MEPSEETSRPRLIASNDFLDEGASVELVGLVEVTEWLIQHQELERAYEVPEPRPCVVVVLGTVWKDFDSKRSHLQSFRHFFERWCGWVNPW